MNIYKYVTGRRISVKLDRPVFRTQCGKKNTQIFKFLLAISIATKNSSKLKMVMSDFILKLIDLAWNDP